PCGLFRPPLHDALPILLSEDALVPELREHRARGWYRQQLIKLAIAERVASDYYLTFDADVVATRPITIERLLPGGRAPCTLLPGDRKSTRLNSSNVKIS